MSFTSPVGKSRLLGINQNLTVCFSFDVGKARKSQKNVETQLEDLRGQVKDASMNNIRMNRDLAESALSLCRGQGIVMKSFAPTESSEYYQSPFSTLSKHGAARKHEQSEV